MKERYAFVGMSWWGLNPSEMASAMSRAGRPAEHFEVWNINRRLDRQLMRSPLASTVTRSRLEKLGSSIGDDRYQAIFVVSPHRLTFRMLKYLKDRSRHLVALLGDDPVGARRVHDSCWDLFDLVAAADETWFDRVSGTARHCVMPWGSTLHSDALVSADSYRPQGLVLIGAPYPERIAIAEKMLRLNKLTLQGDSWPIVDGSFRRPSASREQTLLAIRSNREMVINVHHLQFRRGLNPQFFDYAAAGIPQIVVHGDDINSYSIGFEHEQLRGQLDKVELLSDESIVAANRGVIDRVRRNFTFSSCVEGVLDELGV